MSHPSLSKPGRASRAWLALALCATLPTAALAQESAGTPGGGWAAALQQEVQRIFERSRAAVVRIEGSDSHGKLSGTGFFINSTGLLYTSYTVGGETQDLTAVQGDKRWAARRVVADARCGIALLQVEVKETPFLMLGNSRELQVASPLMTVGFPMDLPVTPSVGFLGGFDRKYLGRYFVTTHLRANLAVQRGQGGAPLLNMKGEVVGILISSLDEGSASFALPIEAAEKVNRDFQRFGEVRPGWLGLSVELADLPVEGSTARVQGVFPQAPAEKAGILPQDILLRVGDRKITAPEDMMDTCFFLSASDRMAVEVARNGERLELQVEVSDFPKPEELSALGLHPMPAAKPPTLSKGE